MSSENLTQRAKCYYLMQRKKITAPDKWIIFLKICLLK